MMVIVTIILTYSSKHQVNFFCSVYRCFGMTTSKSQVNLIFVVLFFSQALSYVFRKQDPKEKEAIDYLQNWQLAPIDLM